LSLKSNTIDKGLEIKYNWQRLKNNVV